jgi:hypothetical protein
MANESKKPVCELIGTDGNVFCVIGNVRRALRKAGLNDKAIFTNGSGLSCCK